MVELVDTRDLKSLAHKPACGFDSRLAHHLEKIPNYRLLGRFLVLRAKILFSLYRVCITAGSGFDTMKVVCASKKVPGEEVIDTKRDRKG